MTQNPNLAVMDRFVSAVIAGDTATLHDLCDPEFTLVEGYGLAFSGLYEGADGFLQFLQRLNEALEITRMEMIRTYTTASDPDYIVSEMEIAGTVRATGKEWHSGLLERWHFKDGKVLKVKPHYFNKM